ncbi:hypothetical protein BC940DRAFT_293093 [Gongronella butleri]|nr:hypothetical protein BC940DRAFT_293093 [Gongronella butleri]
MLVHDTMMNVKRTDEQKKLLEVLAEIRDKEASSGWSTLTIEQWVARLDKLDDRRQLPLSTDQRAALQRYWHANGDLRLSANDMMCLYLATAAAATTASSDHTKIIPTTPDPGPSNRTSHKAIVHVIDTKSMPFNTSRHSIALPQSPQTPVHPTPPSPANQRVRTALTDEQVASMIKELDQLKADLRARQQAQAMQQERIDELEAYVKTLEAVTEDRLLSSKRTQDKEAAAERVAAKEAELAQVQEQLACVIRERDVAVEKAAQTAKEAAARAADNAAAASKVKQQLEAAERAMSSLADTRKDLSELKQICEQQSSDLAQERARNHVLQEQVDAVAAVRARARESSTPTTQALVTKYNMAMDDELYLVSLDAEVTDALKKVEAMSAIEAILTSYWWKRAYLILRGYPKTWYHLSCLGATLCTLIFFFVPMPLFNQHHLYTMDVSGHYYTCPTSPFQRLLMWCIDALLFDADAPMVQPY